ncbi:hypothetical protein TNIN_302241 [Trichonephila inaurata madagascariensis]|uniref:Uncharacterized protein n=1 Tax=Trichonephila inaurata madagascariensis TaxID=2747483 RepID=A0A8X6XQ81_9ARAC|nr:hypothetical protein TNIN_302241 [Trichonephila inaurata madagascariensis]
MCAPVNRLSTLQYLTLADLSSSCVSDTLENSLRSADINGMHHSAGSYPEYQVLTLFIDPLDDLILNKVTLILLWDYPILIIILYKNRCPAVPGT